ncbi:uncharacterized protein LOC135501080 [Lineus longissimus]|uniref:uncharacterized protein LOC135501080 n=1 Tax=Lineus longissimus TaxID=88925 RepID=UPI002B4DFF10
MIQGRMANAGLHCQVTPVIGESYPVISGILGQAMEPSTSQWQFPGAMMSPNHPGISPTPHAQGAMKMEACARSNGIQRLRPGDVLYSKKRIDLSFHPDYETDRKVISFETTIQEILEQGKSPDQLPLIEVMQVQVGKTVEHWVLNGNKRLYLYKKLEKYGLLQEIPVQVIPFDQNIYNDRKIFSTLNRGISIGIQLRASEFAFDRRLDILCQRWRSRRRETKPGLLKMSLQQAMQS